MMVTMMDLMHVLLQTYSIKQEVSTFPRPLSKKKKKSMTDTMIMFFFLFWFKSHTRCQLTTMRSVPTQRLPYVSINFSKGPVYPYKQKGRKQKVKPKFESRQDLHTRGLLWSMMSNRPILTTNNLRKHNIQRMYTFVAYKLLMSRCRVKINFVRDFNCPFVYIVNA